MTRHRKGYVGMRNSLVKSPRGRGRTDEIVAALDNMDRHRFWYFGRGSEQLTRLDPAVVVKVVGFKRRDCQAVFG